MKVNKSRFTASLDSGLSQKLTGRGYDTLTRFTHWLGEIQRLAERDPVAAVRDHLSGISLDSWSYETSPSPYTVGMRLKNITPLVTDTTAIL